MMDGDFFKYLFDVAPVVFVMGVGYAIMYNMFKQERKTNLELQEYLRHSDKENLELLKDFSVLLNSIIQISNDNKDKIINSIVSEAKDIKQHIDNRIANIQRKSLDD